MHQKWDMAGHQTSVSTSQQVDVSLNKTPTLNLGLALFQMSSNKTFASHHIQYFSLATVHRCKHTYFVYSVVIDPSKQGNYTAETKKKKNTKQETTERKSSNLKQLDHVLCLRRESSPNRYRHTCLNLRKINSKTKTKIYTEINIVLAVASFKLLKAIRSRGGKKPALEISVS